MNTFYQHIGVLVMCLFYFTWGKKDLWVMFIILNSIIGIILSRK
jgi:hypothetical protein